MLQAITRKKTQLHHRYLGHREPNERRVSEEDEITSLIMGPLAFLPPCAIGAFWMALVKWDNPEIVFPEGKVTHAEMSFWPKNQNIEPDLRVDLSWGEERKLLLVEFKWRAPLSGKDQLQKQWQHYLSNEERMRAWHIFIAPDTSEGSNALSRDDVWKGYLLLRSWFDVLNTLHHLEGPETHLLWTWSLEVQRFLGALGICPFRGFKRLSTPEIARQNGEVFWRGFDGFVHLANLDVPTLNTSHNAFFTAGGHRG